MNPNNEQYRRDLVAHGNAINERLAAYPPAVAEFLRTQFQLQLYPIAFLEKMGAAVMALLEQSAPSPLPATTDVARAIHELEELKLDIHSDMGDAIRAKSEPEDAMTRLEAYEDAMGLIDVRLSDLRRAERSAVPEAGWQPIETAAARERLRSLAETVIAKNYKAVLLTGEDVAAIQRVLKAFAAPPLPAAPPAEGGHK